MDGIPRGKPLDPKDLYLRYMRLVDNQLQKTDNYPNSVIPVELLKGLTSAVSKVRDLEISLKKEAAAEQILSLKDKKMIIEAFVNESPELLDEMLKEEEDLDLLPLGQPDKDQDK